MEPLRDLSWSWPLGRGPLRVSVLGPGEKKQTQDRFCSEQSCQLCRRGVGHWAAFPGLGGGGQPWGGCPGLAFPCSLRNVVEMDPYLGLFLIPQELWRCLVFPRLSCCSRERSRTLGTVPGLVWREGHPSPTWGTKPEVQAFPLLCRRPMLLLESLGEEGSGCLPLKLPWRKHLGSLRGTHSPWGG